jgi:sugar lactone lactonase YvrE
MQRSHWQWAFGALVASLATGATRAAEPATTLADKLKGAKFELFANAPGYSEGPSWRDGNLYFCSGALLQVTKTGTLVKALDVNPAGTALRADGHLFICDNKHKALLDLSPDGILRVIVDRFDGKPLNSLNDLTVDARGNVYWTDPDGSSTDKPIGNVFRVRPDGVVSQVATGLAFPNGLDVDPKGEFLYLIESQTKKILRSKVPADDQPLGEPEPFFDLGGSGGDGCTFDAAGNFWVADFHRPETKRGRITVLSPAAKVLATLDVPAEVVSNITFGGPNLDEIFCTTGNPPGVFRAKVGVKGFSGHPGKPMKMVRTIPISPEDAASPVSARRFGSPGGVGPTRGWYVWQTFDPESWAAEVRHEGTGKTYTVRVLPWATTYRHLTYGAHPDELLPGERVNLFFSPDDKQQRGYLVHFQDEIGQMKGHGHVWEVRSVAADGTFTARVLAGDKPLDDKTPEFRLSDGARHWRGGKRVDAPALKVGDRLFMTWVYHAERRIVHLTSDDASLNALKAKAESDVNRRLAAKGLAGQVESVDGATIHVLIFSTYWTQSTVWKVGQPVEIRATGSGVRPVGDGVAGGLISRKNLGTYGSGPTEVTVRLDGQVDGKALAAGSIVRLRVR